MPVPARPLLTLTQAVTAGNLGSNQLAFGTQAGLPTCTLFRSGPDGVICLTRQLESGEIYKDFNVQPDITYQYYGHSTNGSGDSAQSNIVAATLSLSTGILHQVAKGSSTNNADGSTWTVIEIYNQEGQRDTRTRLGNVLVMPADAKPEITTSPLLGRTLSIPVFVPQSSISVFRALKVAMKTDALWCYRDALGTHMFGTFPAQSLEEDLNGEVTISMAQGRYFEHVEAA